MLNLFSTNQSQRELKFLFKFDYIVFTSEPVNTNKNHQHIKADHNPQNWTYHLHIKEKLEDQELILEGHHKKGHTMKRSRFQH